MNPDKFVEREPRWPGWIAIAAIGAVLSALPAPLRLGPDWLVLVLMVTLQAVGIFLHFRGHHKGGQMVAYVALGVGTVALVTALGFLIEGLPSKREGPKELLISAGALWLANILVFASWYWRLDAGGPMCRDLVESHTDGAFLFPQMSLDKQLRAELGESDWRPGFIDYLFLAYNTSTAFSPTDVPVLSRWAKVLMMVQSGLSLATLAILAARAINIL